MAECEAATPSCPWESLQMQGQIPADSAAGSKPVSAGHGATRAQKLTGSGSSHHVSEGKAGIRFASAAQGCTKGFHSKEKPPEPFRQEETSDKLKAKPMEELIIQGPKSAEKMQRERPRSTRAQKATQRMKYWSCCGVKTTDFSAFLEQTGCSSGRHCWAGKRDKKAVSCRQDWHQTGSQVVVTVYAKNPLPALCSVKANRTVLEVYVIFEGNKVFQAELDLWGVIEIEKSFVSMVPTKVEIMLCKASPGSWARLELPQSRPQSCGKQEEEAAKAEEPGAAQVEHSDDSLSWSEEDDEELEMGTSSN